MRLFKGASPAIWADTSFYLHTTMHATQTYGAFPDPGTTWTTAAGERNDTLTTVRGFYYKVVLGVATP